MKVRDTALTRSFRLAWRLSGWRGSYSQSRNLPSTSFFGNGLDSQFIQLSHDRVLIASRHIDEWNYAFGCKGFTRAKFELLCRVRVH